MAITLDDFEVKSKAIESRTKYNRYKLLFLEAYNKRAEARLKVVNQTNLTDLKDKLSSDGNYTQDEKDLILKALPLVATTMTRVDVQILDANNVMTSIISSFTAMKNEIDADSDYDITVKNKFTQKLIDFDNLYQEV